MSSLERKPINSEIAKHVIHQARTFTRKRSLHPEENSWHVHLGFSRRELAPLGVELWVLELLAALRRSGGPPYRLAAGALLKETQLTSGAITKRVARLEEKGWVRR